MIAAQPFQAYDDNPCRPRHFKPPPCAPVIAEGPARKALDACRARLFFTGILFACVFGVVALRVVEVVLLEGGTANRICRGSEFRHHLRPPAPTLSTATAGSSPRRSTAPRSTPIRSRSSTRRTRPANW